jgi:hypothetical protein
LGKLGLALAACVAILSGSAAWAESDTQRHMRRACAAYDLHTIISLEDHGPNVSGSVVAQAFDALVTARTACMAGRYFDGVRVYRAISLKAEAATTTVSASR